MLALTCPAQNYDWGRKAEHSEVAQLAKANGVQIDETKAFAELWVGTHVNGPAKIAGSACTLKQWIQAHPAAVGDRIFSVYGADLPFLLKVLSVNTALSIQSHPDKKLAERLHASHPQHYKDDNHKPEMALSLSDFEALCSFVTTAELRENLAMFPELRSCVGEDEATNMERAGTEEEEKKALRAAFTALMTRDPDTVAKAIDTMVIRLEAKSHLNAREKLVLRLNTQYPHDVGVFSSLFLNYVTLQPGQAIYLAANEPHAYLAGELVECMATSDNVIRAGLTPKFKHTEVLCESLTYSQGLPEVLEGTPVTDSMKLYRPPFQEFEIRAVRVTAGTEVHLPINEGPQLLLVQHGTGSATVTCSIQDDALLKQADLHRGQTFFIPAGAAVSISAETDITIWGAACNGTFFLLESVLEAANAQPAAVNTAAAV